MGGAVRDRLMGREAGDWDVCTTALPRDILKVFPRAIPTGIAHGTVTVVIDDAHYEVTTLRGDVGYTDGRRPDSVVFLDDITQDLARRDFTVNAIAYDPLSNLLVDPYDGVQDLHRRVLRAVGDASARFNEDGLRALRCARFVATLDFDLDPATESALDTALDVFRKVSHERVRDEWLKALRAPQPSRAFDVMRRHGLLTAIVPEIAVSDARWATVMALMDAIPRERPLVRLTVLLGEVSLAVAEAWLRAYRYSNDERDRVLHLHRHRILHSHRTETDPELRRWLREVGVGALQDLFALYDAAVTDADRADVTALRARVEAMVAAGAPLSTRDLAVDGGDLMRTLGIPPSRRVGELLAGLLEAVLDDPAINERERLLTLARGMIEG